jgi:putative oxidoreductase
MAFNRFFESKKEYGVLLLRLLVGIRLVEGMWNIIFDGQIQGVAGFFDQFHIPLPMLSAVLAVYAEFICGILFITGLWVRMAALVMIFTFTIAIVVVDIHNGFEKAFPAWTIWAVSIFLLFYGAGKFSIDEKLLNRRRVIMP